MTYPFAVCLAGLVLWLIFSKTTLADAWVAEVGRICFWVGLLVTLLGASGKSLF